jgi:hypothetical protein
MPPPAGKLSTGRNVSVLGYTEKDGPPVRVESPDREDGTSSFRGGRRSWRGQAEQSANTRRTVCLRTYRMYGGSHSEIRIHQMIMMRQDVKD